MTSMCLFGTLYALLPAVFVVSFRVCFSVKTSKACFGTQASQFPCTKHTLWCSSGMIAIQDAYYTNSTACPVVGLNDCDNINVTIIPDTGRYQNFSDTELKKLYKECSTEQNCTFNGERRSDINLSIVKFICNNDSYNVCDQVNAKVSDTFYLWKRNNSPDEVNTCTCTISALQKNTKLSLTVLDMRLKNTRWPCPGVTITEDGNSFPVNCSQLSPYQLLVNKSQQVQVTVNKREADVKGVLRIGIQGRNTVNLTCNEKIPTTTDLAPSTTDSISTVNSPTTSETNDTPHLSPSSVPPSLTTSVDTSHLSPSSVPLTLTTSVYTSHLIPSSVPLTLTTTDDTPNLSSSPVTPTLITSVSSTIVTNLQQMKTQKKPGTGTVIAVVIPCLLIIVAIVLIAVFIIRRKKAETTKKDDKTNPNTKSQEEYSLARDVHQNEYFEIEKSPAKMDKRDYDNAGFVNTSGNPSSKEHEVYSLAGIAHSNEYFEIEPTAPQKSLMAYDYAELSNTHASTSQNGENVGSTNIQVHEDDYDHVGGKPVTQNGHYDTTASVAKTLPKSNSTDKKGDVYSYDHLNDKSTRENANNDYNVAGRPSDYDTTASIQKRFDHATECREDDYGYNHLGNQVQKKTLQNDYDTSASAVTAVARLNSRTDEPDYDHVTKDTRVDSVPSSHNIPENNEDDSDVYTLARKGDNPYQLAK